MTLITIVIAPSETNFYFGEVKDGKTIPRTETRMRSMSFAAERQIRKYWFVVGFGVRLSMRSLLRAIARSAHRRRWEHRAVTA